MGSAPAAHILAIRAFGTSGKGAESTSYVILRGLDLAAAHGAQIVNMSFAGPKDALIERGIAALSQTTSLCGGCQRAVGRRIVIRRESGDS